MIPNPRYTRNQRLNSLLTSQENFNRVVTQTQKQFARQKEFFRFYKLHSQVSASYLDNMWRAKSRPRGSVKPPDASDYDNFPGSRSPARIVNQTVGETPGAQNDTHNFEEFLGKARGECGENGENIEHEFHVQSVIAAV